MIFSLPITAISIALQVAVELLLLNMAHTYKSGAQKRSKKLQNEKQSQMLYSKVPKLSTFFERTTAGKSTTVSTG